MRLFPVDDDETRVGLVPVLLNRIKLRQSVFCFAFLREVDSTSFGVHVVQPSLSGVLSSLQISSPAYHPGHQNGHHE